MMDASIQSAMTLAQSAPIAAPQKSASYQKAHKAAVEFEGVFIGQFMGEMFQDISTDGPFGGGQGEAMFRSLMLDQYSKQMANRGGFGLADSITRALLSHQEARR
jgi:Rod binding domain-containing protein